MTKEHKSSGWKNFFVILGVIFAILIIWNLFFSSTEQSNQQVKNGTEVTEKIKQDIVWVKYDVTGKTSDGSYFETSASGSGVIYYINGTQMQVFTNRHVIDCDYSDLKCYQRLSEKIQIRTQDGKMHNVAKVLYAPHGLDLAVLELSIDSNENYDSVYVRKEGLQLGEKVTAVGYPAFNDKVLEFSVSDGTITNFRDLIMNDGFAFNSIDSDAYTYFGSSGGGLFDKDGNLIGINTWLANTQTSIAIKINVIDNFGNWNYCKSDSYSVGNYCVNYCDRTEVLGADNQCYKPCNGFYCKSDIPKVSDSRCDAGYIAGTDGYCHLPCGSVIEYCSGSDNICFKNRCYGQCSQGSLFEDGTCRLYQ